MKNVDIDILKSMVSSSFSFAEVVRRCGFKNNNYHYRVLKKRIHDNNIDITHFLGMAHSKGKVLKKLDINDLSNKKYISTNRVKQKLIQDGLKEHKCEICGITEWQGKPTPIQLDHIDGDTTNNKLENLRILCPNCHAQTDTYCGKNKIRKSICECNRKKGKHQTYCEYCRLKYQIDEISNNKTTVCICGNPKCLKSKLCRKCNNKLLKPHTRKIVVPSKEELLELVKITSFIKIGKMYSVSNTTIKKWCKLYGLPYNRKDIKNMYTNESDG